jgi:hypothetical protein
MEGTWTMEATVPTSVAFVFSWAWPVKAREIRSRIRVILVFIFGIVNGLRFKSLKYRIILN